MQSPQNSLNLPKNQMPFAIEYFIFSSLSIMSLTILFFIFCKFKELHTIQYRIIQNIFIFDMIYTFIMFLDSFVQFIINDTSKSIVNFHFLCLTEAFTINYTIIAATVWTSIVCHNLYANTFEIQVKYYIYRFIGYGIPAVFSLIPLFINGYGVYYPMPQTNCFFNTELDLNKFLTYKFCFFYIPVWGSFLFNLIIIIIVIFKLYSLLGQSPLKVRSILFSLLIYPLILLICWIIPDLLLQFNLASGYAVQGLGPLIGLFDSLAYGFQNLRRKIQINGCKLYLKEECSELEQ